MSLKPGWSRYDWALAVVGGVPCGVVIVLALYVVAVRIQHIPLEAILQGTGLMIGVVIVFMLYIRLIQWLASRSEKEKSR